MSLLLAYYGDDFTGSTDVMEALTQGGVETVLFLAPPTQAQLARFPTAEAVGIAGTSRALTPTQMDAQLPDIFAALDTLGAKFCHYKVCSTFDSSPELGSIGRALELGAARFSQPFIPLVVGAPALRRYVVFGNLFATAEGQTYRLDRHPTMSRHPATPMSEGDLRRHLRAQTHLDIDLLDVLALDGGVASCLKHMQNADADVVLFDTLDDTHLRLIGEMLLQLVAEGIRFVAGSSGLEYALVAHLVANGELKRRTTWPEVGRAEPIVVTSGSAAPATAVQLSTAERQGFDLIRVDAPALLAGEVSEHIRLKGRACASLARGQSVALYTARGPDDPALSQTHAAAAHLGYKRSDVGRLLGTAQGNLLADILAASGVRRACIVGGDTCGYAAQQLGIYALTLLRPIAPGSPLCRTYSEDQATEGLTLALKAGQVGSDDYFLHIQQGY